MSHEIKDTYLMPELDGQFTVTNGDKVEAQLTIKTYKYYGHLLSRAHIGFLNGGFETVRMYQDYAQRVVDSQKRATRKAVETQHAEALAMLDDIKAAAIAHYAPAEQVSA